MVQPMNSAALAGGIDCLASSRITESFTLDVMPIFIGRGLRLFDHTKLAQLRLEKTGLVEVGARTSLRFRVRK